MAGMLGMMNGGVVTRPRTPVAVWRSTLGIAEAAQKARDVANR